MPTKTNFEATLIINAKFPRSVGEFKCLKAVNFNSLTRVQSCRTHQVRTITIVGHYQTLSWWNVNNIETLSDTHLFYNGKVCPTK